MKIELIRSIWHDGVTHPVGAIIDVKADAGEFLIEKDKAIKFIEKPKRTVKKAKNA